mmetsp:Transcript_24353/g.61604  ORF Transcript_24353/g.61604 Transcript_24353/m.61604 type:complete len:174 (+) Transcript_24353:586-1107(+)
MQDYPFMDKPIRIQFARQKSDAVAKREGTWKPVDRRDENKRKNEEFARRIAEKRQRQAAALATAGAPQEQVQAVAASVPQVFGSSGDSSDVPKAGTPNHILFAQDLPDRANQDALGELFKQYQGFREVRLVPGKDGIAFIEFETEVQATDAMLGLQGFALTPEHKLKLSYAKK